MVVCSVSPGVKYAPKTIINVGYYEGKIDAFSSVIKYYRKSVIFRGYVIKYYRKRVICRGYRGLHSMLYTVSLCGVVEIQ